MTPTLQTTTRDRDRIRTQSAAGLVAARALIAKQDCQLIGWIKKPIDDAQPNPRSPGQPSPLTTTNHQEDGEPNENPKQASRARGSARSREHPRHRSEGILERWPSRARSTSAKRTITSSPEQIQIGRFSAGMERITATPSTLRLGRFSDGQALPLTASPDRLGSFADGQVARPDAAARLRVGSFGDGYGTAATGRSASRRRPSNATPADGTRDQT